MADPRTFSGRYNIWIGPDALTAAQIKASKPTETTPVIPMHDSGTPFLWHFIDVEADGQVDINLPKEVERQKTQDKGVVKISGKMLEKLMSAKFNISDVSLKNICQVGVPNPNKVDDGLTEGGIPIQSIEGLDLSALAGKPFLFTHKEYGYTVSGGERYPKIGTGADPAAVIMYLGTNVSEINLGGQPPQQLLGVELEGVSVTDSDGTSMAGFVELDLTAYTKET